MKYLFFIFLLLPACLQTENSNSLDDKIYAPTTAEFRAARSILNTNCANCHIYHTMTESELVADGVVVANSPDTSPLYYRMTGSGGTTGPKDMPPSGGLSASDLTTVYNWILGM